MVRSWFRKNLILACGLLLLSASAGADMVELEFSVSFGAVPADGSTPWITATIADGADAPGVAAGSVLLTVTVSSDIGAADVTQLYFNYNGDPAGLSFDSTTAPANVDAISSYSILQATADSYRAGGDGYYDFRIDLPTENSTDESRLTEGESISFIISGSGPLSPSDFYYLSYQDGGEGNAGPFYAAAHIQSTGPEQLDSDWVAAVPLPAAVWLFASSMLMFLVAARRRRYAPAAG